MTREEIQRRVELDRLDARTRHLENRTAPLDLAEIDAAKARADGALTLWNEKASDPVPGESATEYRRRLLKQAQAHSPRYAGKDFSLTSYDALDTAETMVFGDVRQAAFDPSTVPPGQLRPVRERDQSGRLITKWVGASPTWMDVFMQPGARGILSRKIAGLE